MMYSSKEMEEKAILETAAKMCAAARTAPKGKGVDTIETLVLTGDEKEALAQKMLEISEREFPGQADIFARDAGNLRASAAIVLIGVRKNFMGLTYCSYCGFENCGACAKAGARCAFDWINLGIALSSAAAVAADARIDNRIMYTVGKAASEMGYTEDKTVLWHGIPLSTSGKSIYFDRG